MFGSPKFLDVSNVQAHFAVQRFSLITGIRNSLKLFGKRRADPLAAEREQFHERFAALLRSVESATSGGLRSSR